MTDMSTLLPSPESLLAAFRAGTAPPDASGREILQFGIELVDAHRRCYTALDRLRVYAGAPHDHGDRWAVTTAQWLYAGEEIDSLVVAVEELVRQRSIPVTVDPATPAQVVTESVGHVISRLAGLWVQIGIEHV